MSKEGDNGHCNGNTNDILIYYHKGLYGMYQDV